MDKRIYILLLTAITTSMAFDVEDLIVDDNISYRPKWKPPSQWWESLRNNNGPATMDQNEAVAYYSNLNPEPESNEIYGIENVRIGRDKRRQNYQDQTYLSLCPSKRKTVYLNLNDDYEYRPDHYDEVRCSHTHRNNDPNQWRPRPITSLKNKPICSEAGFSCIQLNRTIFLTRRAIGSECWEVETRLVQAGCECMWPRHQFGDMAE